MSVARFVLPEKVGDSISPDQSSKERRARCPARRARCPPCPRTTVAGPTQKTRDKVGTPRRGVPTGELAGGQAHWPKHGRLGEASFAPAKTWRGSKPTGRSMDASERRPYLGAGGGASPLAEAWTPRRGVPTWELAGEQAHWPKHGRLGEASLPGSWRGGKPTGRSIDASERRPYLGAGGGASPLAEAWTPRRGVPWTPRRGVPTWETGFPHACRASACPAFREIPKGLPAPWGAGLPASDSADA